MQMQGKDARASEGALMLVPYTRDGVTRMLIGSDASRNVVYCAEGTEGGGLAVTAITLQEAGNWFSGAEMTTTLIPLPDGEVVSWPS